MLAAELFMTLRFLREEFVDLLGPSGWFGGDGERTLEAARVWLDGGQPYDVFGFLYSPLALALFGPFAALGDDLAIKAWLGLGVAGIVGCTLHATRRLPVVARLLGVALVLAFHATVGDYLLANTTMVLVSAMYLVIAGGDTVRSGLLLGVLAAAFPKPMLVPFLLWALVWRPRALGGVVAGGLAATAVALVVVGPALHLRFLEALLTGGGITYRFAGNYGLSLVSPALWAVVAGFTFLALAYVLWRRGEVVGLVWAIAGGILVSPYAPMYSGLPYVLALPALAGIAPALAVGYALIVIATEQATPLSAVVILLASLLLPYRFDRRGRTPLAEMLAERARIAA